MDDRSYSPSEFAGNGDTFRVGGRPVEGHRRIRPRRGPRPPTERGHHMRVSTANPHFVRTDRGGRDSRYYYRDRDREGERPLEAYGAYGPRDGISRGRNNRGGGAPFRPNTQDLVGVGRMPMQSDEWDRYRDSKEPESPFQPVHGADTWNHPRRRSHPRPMMNMNHYERGRDDVRFFGTREREELPPHFLTDDQEGLAVEEENDMDRMSPPPMPPPLSDREDRRSPRDFAFARPEESLREKEWRDLEDRRQRRRRRPRPAPQDLRGVGPMPMRGREWDDYTNFPERRGGGGGIRRGGYGNDFGGDMEYPSSRYFRRGGQRDEYREDLVPPPPPLPPPRSREEMQESEYDEDYIRDGPHMIRNNGLRPPRDELEDIEEEEERRRRMDRRGEGGFYDGDDNDNDDDRYFARDGPGRPDYSRRGRRREDEPPRPPPLEEDFGRRDQNRNLFNFRQRDRPGSVGGGPMEEEDMGVDTQYTANRPRWSTGTSYDTA